MHTSSTASALPAYAVQIFVAGYSVTCAFIREDCYAPEAKNRHAVEA